MNGLTLLLIVIAVLLILAVAFYKRGDDEVEVTIYHYEWCFVDHEGVIDCTNAAYINNEVPGFCPKHNRPWVERDLLGRRFCNYQEDEHCPQ